MEEAKELLTTPPAGKTFTALEAGYDFTCGLETGGGVSCWGMGVGQLDAPVGFFTTLSVNPNGFHACALRSDAAPVCWGNDTYGVASAPGGSFASVDAGDTMACGLRTDGTPYCIGEPRSHTGSNTAGVVGARVESELRLSDGSYTYVSSHPLYGHGAPVCGVGTGGAVVCEAGKDIYGKPNQMDGRYEWDIPAGSFTAVGVGDQFACGLKTGGAIACWGTRRMEGELDAVAEVPSGSFTSLSVGVHHACGLATDGSITCWGSRDTQGRPPPKGSFTAVSVGSSLTCALKSEDGSLVCWGGQSGTEGAAPPEGDFTAVSVGMWHACGLRPGGVAECWIWETQPGHGLGQAAPPSGVFTSVSAGNSFTCGIRPDTSLVCWGWMVR